MPRFMSNERKWAHEFYKRLTGYDERMQQKDECRIL